MARNYQFSARFRELAGTLGGLLKVPVRFRFGGCSELKSDCKVPRRCRGLSGTSGCPRKGLARFWFGGCSKYLMIIRYWQGFGSSLKGVAGALKVPVRFRLGGCCKWRRNWEVPARLRKPTVGLGGSLWFRSGLGCAGAANMQGISRFQQGSGSSLTPWGASSRCRQGFGSADVPN